VEATCGKLTLAATDVLAPCQPSHVEGASCPATGPGGSHHAFIGASRQGRWKSAAARAGDDGLGVSVSGVDSLQRLEKHSGRASRFRQRTSQSSCPFPSCCPWAWSLTNELPSDSFSAAGCLTDGSRFSPGGRALHPPRGTERDWKDHEPFRLHPPCI